ncbi:hypothetical protein HDU93_000458 [Gonapodya sp. JEL0774]|nr:hypothetical protein HDU93_000458 [Gonapodya sp. JEL0774]
MYHAVTEANIVWAVAHVLRYSVYNAQLKQLISSGAIGRVINVQHLEPVGWQHFAHSYVRGNWRKEADSSFLLMTKSCHDVDILNHLLGDAELARVSSFGSLTHFKRDQKPWEAGSATRGLTSDPPSNTGWPVSVLTEVVDIEHVTNALKDGPYGRCVYESDNDVCDHQVVNMEFSNGRTASFTVVAFSWDLCVRKTRVFGTNGEISGDGYEITVANFVTQEKKTYKPFVEGLVSTQFGSNSASESHSNSTGARQNESTGSFDVRSGHGGGDTGVLVAFLRTVIEGVDYVKCSVAECLESHLWVFAAEEARKESKIVNLAEFKQRHGIGVRP